MPFATKAYRNLQGPEWDTQFTRDTQLSQSLIIYPDASVRKNAAGCAAVIPRSDGSLASIESCLPVYVTPRQAETLGVGLACLMVVSQLPDEPYGRTTAPATLILCDSSDSIEAILSKRDPLACKVHELMLKANASIRWSRRCSSHGNIEADRLAKRVAGHFDRIHPILKSELLPVCGVEKAFSTRIMKSYLRRIRSKRWAKAIPNLGRTLHFLFDTQDAPRRLKILHRSLIFNPSIIDCVQGHNFAPASQALYGHISSELTCPWCDVKVLEANMVHYLTQCPRFSAEREDLDLTPNGLRELFRTTDTFGPMANFLRYIAASFEKPRSRRTD